MTSRSTRDIDLKTKPRHYWRCGVPCYVIVDELPRRRPRQLRIIGYQRGPRRLPAPGVKRPGPLVAGGMQMWLGQENGRVVCYDQNGQPIPNPVQAALERELAEQARQQAEEERDQAEQRAAQAEQGREQAGKPASRPSSVSEADRRGKPAGRPNRNVSRPGNMLNKKPRPGSRPRPRLLVSRKNYAGFAMGNDFFPQHNGCDLNWPGILLTMLMGLEMESREGIKKSDEQVNNNLPVRPLALRSDDSSFNERIEDQRADHQRRISPITWCPSASALQSSQRP